jgi:tetratricopeptide (TPR) repeat protein
MFALVLGALLVMGPALPLRAQFAIEDIGLRNFPVDAPEVKLERLRTSSPKGTLLLTQLHNKVCFSFFGASEDKPVRLWKSPALALDLDSPELFSPEKPGVRPSYSLEYDEASGTAILTYEAYVRDSRDYPTRVLFLKHSPSGFRVLRLAEKRGALEIRADSPLADPEKTWLTAFLKKMALTIYAFPSTKSSFVLPEAVVAPPIDEIRSLAEIHAKARALRGTHKPQDVVVAMERFLLEVDVRDLRSGEETLIRLNDLGYWLGESGRPQTALFLLDEVIRRDPRRTVAYLNRGDLRYTLAESWKSEGTRNQALEDYRAYVLGLLGAGKAVPPSVAVRLKERLGLGELTVENCRSRFSLFEAIEAGDLERLRSLLEQGANPS